MQKNVGADTPVSNNQQRNGANNAMNTIKSNAILCYVFVYSFLWIILTFVANSNIPAGDAMEAFNWARNLDFGTPRSGWLVGLLIYPALFFESIELRSFYWYFIHFLGVAVGLLGVWALTLRLTLKKKLAWLAVLALNLTVVISSGAQNQNDNYILVMLWPWMLYFFILASFDDTRFWLIFAAIAGLATMAKYSTLLLKIHYVRHPQTN